jgi:hypothetical protein
MHRAVSKNQAQCDRLLRELLEAAPHTFKPALQSALPERHGVYLISIENGEASTLLWVGRTHDSKGGLRRRVWKDHFKEPTNSSDLPRRLLREALSWSVADAKRWISEQCKVRWIIVEDIQMCQLLEWYAQGVLRPVLNSAVTPPMSTCQIL